MRWIKFLLIILFLNGLFPGAGICEKRELRIGLITPLSGTYSALGNYVKNGIKLGLSELNSDISSQVKLFIEDDGWSVSRSVSAYQKLKLTEKIDVVIAVGSAVGNALAPLAEKDQIPFVAIGASDSNVAKGRKFAFTHWVSPEAEAIKLADEIKRRDYKRFAFIGAEHEGVIAVRDALNSVFNASGITERLVLNELFLATETDFRTFIAKARQKQVDVVIVCLFSGGPLASFAKQARVQGLKVDLAGMEMFEDEREVKASDAALVGHWYVNADVATPAFEKAYRAKYNEHPGWAAANGYDVINLFVKAFRKYGNDRSMYASFLANLADYQGAAGTYSATGDNRFTLPAAVKVVTMDGFKKL
jgi:branched-chain amino acid transport system substrate-binding protein